MTDVVNESLPRTPSLKDIATLYRYSPLSITPTETLLSGADLDRGLNEAVTSIGNFSMHTPENGTPNRTEQYPNGIGYEYDYPDVVLQSDFGAVNIQTWKRIYRDERDHSTLHMSLFFTEKESTAKQYVGGIKLSIDPESVHIWRLSHRHVTPQFRRQGVGSTLLRAAEQFVQRQADYQEHDQELHIILGQVDVLLWALKRGYVPRTDEDAAAIKRVFSGDPTLTLISLPVTKHEPFARDWYIFEKEKANIPQQQFAAEGERYHPEQNVHDSIRIRLKKMFPTHTTGEEKIRSILEKAG